MSMGLFPLFNFIVEKSSKEVLKDISFFNEYFKLNPITKKHQAYEQLTKMMSKDHFEEILCFFLILISDLSKMGLVYPQTNQLQQALCHVLKIDPLKVSDRKITQRRYQEIQFPEHYLPKKDNTMDQYFQLPEIKKEPPTILKKEPYQLPDYYKLFIPQKIDKQIIAEKKKIILEQVRKNQQIYQNSSSITNQQSSLNSSEMKKESIIEQKEKCDKIDEKERQIQDQKVKQQNLISKVKTGVLEEKTKINSGVPIKQKDLFQINQWEENYELPQILIKDSPPIYDVKEEDFLLITRRQDRKKFTTNKEFKFDYIPKQNTCQLKKDDDQIVQLNVLQSNQLKKDDSLTLCNNQSQPQSSIELHQISVREQCNFANSDQLLIKEDRKHTLSPSNCLAIEKNIPINHQPQQQFILEMKQQLVNEPCNKQDSDQLLIKQSEKINVILEEKFEFKDQSQQSNELQQIVNESCNKQDFNQESIEENKTNLFHQQMNTNIGENCYNNSPQQSQLIGIEQLCANITTVNQDQSEVQVVSSQSLQQQANQLLTGATINNEENDQLKILDPQMIKKINKSINQTTSPKINYLNDNSQSFIPLPALNLIDQGSNNQQQKEQQNLESPLLFNEIQRKIKLKKNLTHQYQCDQKLFIIQQNNYFTNRLIKLHHSKDLSQFLPLTKIRQSEIIYLNQNNQFDYFSHIFSKQKKKISRIYQNECTIQVDEKLIEKQKSFNLQITISKNVMMNHYHRINYLNPFRKKLPINPLLNILIPLNFFSQFINSKRKNNQHIIQIINNFEKHRQKEIDYQDDIPIHSSNNRGLPFSLMLFTLFLKKPDRRNQNVPKNIIILFRSQKNTTIALLTVVYAIYKKKTRNPTITQKNHWNYKIKKKSINKENHGSNTLRRRIIYFPKRENSSPIPRK